MRGVLLVLWLLAPMMLSAQLVRGRVLESDGRPVPRAIIELRRVDGPTVVRATSGPTGSFAMTAPSPGRYTVRIAAIGYNPHTGMPFEVPSGGVTYGDARLARVAVTLADLEVLRTARCGSLQGGSEAMSRLLDGARTSLEVMGSSLSGAGDGFRVQMVHRRAMATSRDSSITADTTAAAMSRWPIEAIDPDSIRKVGFRVRGNFDVGEGHYWFGPDVRVLFADWFLEEHCFRVAPRASDSAAIVVEFSPAERDRKIDIAGTLELDPETLALRRLSFEHRNLARPLRNGDAGGELRFAELPGGLWLPVSWRLYAPIVESVYGRAVGVSERSGRVLGSGADSPPAPAPLPRRARALEYRVPREHLTPPDSINDVRRYTTALDAACPHPSPRDRDVLLANERQLAAAASDRSATADDWHALACVRGLLDLAEVFGREGLLMPLGAGWLEGATNAWLEALAHDNTHLASAEGLAVLALDQTTPKKGVEVRAALARAVHNGVTAPAVVRACALFALRASELERSNLCAVEGLRDGGDSTWQMLHLSRLAAHGADTLMVTTLFDAALKSAHDPDAWSEVGWHLRWFTEPEEWQEWKGLADSIRPAWVRDRLASRDVRDGRRPGARLMEHFRRLDHAEAQYIRDMPRRFRGYSVLAANHDKGGRPVDPDDARLTFVPETVPAMTFREYLPVVEWLDDRGVVFLRFGRPSNSVSWRDTTPGSGMVREAWLYGVDNGRLLVNFESEAFDGSIGATRLVTGVLGGFLCELDAVRCSLTNRLTCFELGPQPGCDRRNRSSPLSRERLEVLRTEDRSDIAIATTTDDNSPRVDHPIATVAQLHRVWDPKSGAPLAVISYAFTLGDVERDADTNGITATLELALRQWSSATATWSSTDFQRRLRFSGRWNDDASLTGYSVVPSSPDVSAWSLFATQGTDRSGRAWGDRLPPLTSGPLAISDLVIGAESQGQTWTTTGGTQVPLGPLGAFDKDAPVSLYWQVRSSAARDPVRITIALYEAGPRDTEKPVLEVSFDGRLEAGLNELQRNLGVADLDGGTYRVQVTVRDGELSVVRSGRLLLR